MSTQKTVLHPVGRSDVDLYPKTSADQIEGLAQTVGEIVGQLDAPKIFLHKIMMKPDLNINYYIRVYSSSSIPYENDVSKLRDLLPNNLLFKYEYGGVLPDVGCVLDFVPREVLVDGNYGELAYTALSSGEAVIVNILSLTDTVVEV